MSKGKIIVTDKLAPEGIDYLREKGFQVDAKFGIPHNDLLEIIDEYDAIIVRSATKIKKDIIERATNLKVAGRAGNGVDNIDIIECTKKGIAVVNTPLGNIVAAAEMGVAMACAMFRNIPQAYHAGKNNDFRRSNFVGEELEGKIAGVIGLGKIGSIVASKLSGMGMKVIGYDPYVTKERFHQMNVEKYETIEEILKIADLVTLHIPKCPENHGLIGEKELAMCKKGVRLVNVARGGMIDEKALYEAVKSGHVAGAALDVQDTEPNFNLKPEDQEYKNPLLELDNIIITPHLGASTKEASYNVSIGVAETIEKVLNGEFVSAVNMPAIRGKVSDLKPYIDLAEILGKIYYQAEKKTVEKIEIVYSGDLANKETKPITLALLKGFLSQVNRETVNYINAEMKLAELGVELEETKSSHLDKYTNLITVKFHTESRVLPISGTVFAKDVLRIVDFFGYKLDFEPTQHVIAIQNVDKPGVIGHVGTVLGNYGVNIGAMQWSRNRKGDKAVSFVSVDNKVPDEILDKLKEFELILKISMLQLTEN